MKTAISAILVFITLGVFGQKTYVIKGSFNGQQNGKKIILSYYDARTTKIKDSAYVYQNHFMFTGQVPNFVRARLEMRDSSDMIGPWTTSELINADFQEFFLEDTTIYVKGDSIRNAKIVGGEVQRDYNVLQKIVRPLDRERKPYTLKVLKYMQNGDSVRANELFDTIRNYNKKIRQAKKDFMQENLDSYVTLALLQESGTSELDPDGFEATFKGLSDRLRNSAMGKTMWARYEAIRATSIGHKAPDFVLPDVHGQSFDLKSSRGKYILLDFWASWCGPCRNENPNLIKAYQAFKDKGFDIISVSLDTQKSAWLKAIKTDGLPWKTHLSDLRGTQNKAAVLYGVKGIPANFLIDPNGVIIAKGLRGEGLFEKLTQIFENKTPKKTNTKTK